VVVDKAAKAAMSSCTNDVAVATYPSFISLWTLRVLNLSLSLSLSLYLSIFVRIQLNS
jgi:hypothetical protein